MVQEGYNRERKRKKNRKTLKKELCCLLKLKHNKKRKVA